MTTKQINTTIPVDYWKRAVLNDLSWSKLLCFAIDVFNSENFDEKKKLLSDQKNLEAKAKACKKRIKELEEQELKDKESKKLEEERLKNTCTKCGDKLTGKIFKLGKETLCKNCFEAI